MTSTLSSEKRDVDQLFDRLQLDNIQINNSEFFDCVFKDCSFTQAVFQKCRFINCTFQGCDLSLVQLPESSFSGTFFENTKCIGINWAQADWPATNLGYPLRFNKCALNHSTFIALNLSGIQITECTALDVDFREADLSQVDFTGTDLAESLFSDTDLSQADLSRARNYQIDPASNNLKNARFSLPEAMSLLYSMDIDLVDGEI